LCLEADVLSFLLRRLTTSCPGRAFLQAVSQAIDVLHELVPGEYLTVCYISLQRILPLLLWYTCSNRKTSDLLLSYLKVDSPRSITYPISGYVDHVTPKVWSAFYSYILGVKNEAKRTIVLLEDLDELAPVGYGTILVYSMEHLYLYSADPYLHQLFGKYLAKSNSRYCSLNSVVLAHYLRAKLLLLKTICVISVCLIECFLL